jgi:hypothetical protein
MHENDLIGHAPGRPFRGSPAHGHAPLGEVFHDLEDFHGQFGIQRHRGSARDIK